MSFIDRIVEKRISDAIEAGELDQGAYKGRPLPDIDTPRRPGWWAEQFVARERARLAAEDDAAAT